MAPVGLIDVEGRSVEAVGDRRYLRGRHKQEDCGRVDEAPDQPGTGDTVDLRPRAGHPDRSPAVVARRQLFFGDKGGLRRAPGLEAAFENLGSLAKGAKMRGDTVAELLAFLAQNDGWPRQAFRPIRHGAVVAPYRSGQQTRIGSEILVVANVDNHRRVRRADDAVEFFGRDFKK